MTKNTGEGTGSLEKAIDILDLISERTDGMSQNELTERLGLPRTTIYRILATLVARGLLRRDPGRRMYCLGFRCVEMAKQVYSMPDLVSAASSELRALRDLTGETSYIGTLEGLDVVSLERYDSPHSQRSNASLGHRKPVYATSQGKAILSALPAELRDSIIRDLNLKPLTELTIIDRRRLQAELRIIQSRGYAIDNEENVMGTRCVGAPVIDQQGVVRGAISVAGPAYRLTMARIELLGPELVDAARHIGAQLQPLKSTVSDSSAHAISAVPQTIHGSHPLWCAFSGRLVWLDTLGPALRFYQPGGEHQKIPVEQPIVGVFFKDQNPVLIMEKGAVLIKGNQVETLTSWTHRQVRAVCNRTSGTLWASMVAGNTSHIGIVESDGTFDPLWQLNETVDYLLWHAQSETLYANAPDSGNILMLKPGSSAVRKFATVPKSSGIISGLDIDANGGLWTALRDGWSVVHFAKDGNLDHVIPLPIPCPTGVAIGGIECRTLYVTSARQFVPLDILKKAPLSGSLFEIAL
ncbi:IclR family transcriptional regulator domain-containing protein [Pseudomonas sp. LB3P14]